jgi:hypothetical protein
MAIIQRFLEKQFLFWYIAVFTKILAAEARLEEGQFSLKNRCWK